METHDLKCETEYFQAVESGKKKFEIRKNDRDFKRLDLVNEETWNMVKKLKNPTINYKTLNTLVVLKIKSIRPELF